MGLLSAIVTAPVAPLYVVPWVARQVLDAAEQEYYDPAVIRRQLGDLVERLEAGEIGEEEFEEIEDELLERLRESERILAGDRDG